MRQLDNPKTKLYYEFKNFVLSRSFPWYMYEQQQNDAFHASDPFAKTKFYHPSMNLEKMGHARTFIHGLLGRPTFNEPYSQPEKYFEHALEVCKEIFNHNRFRINSFLRMAVNMVFPDPNIDTTYIHVDHHHEHHNMLIYLTDAGGETIAESGYHDPKEDDVVIFDGYHTHNVPKTKPRVVLVATFI